MNKKYILTLTDKQARLLVNALDLYTRIGIGQFEEILDVYDPLHKLIPVPVRNAAKRLLDTVKSFYGHPDNGSFGIHSSEVRDDFRQAYDIQQVVRHKLAVDASKYSKGYTVDFDIPRSISEKPLPTMEDK